MLVLRNMKVGARLAAGFGVLLLFIVAILAVVLYGNQQKATQFEHVVGVNMVKMRMLNEMLGTNNAILMHRRLMLIKRGDGLNEDLAHAAKLTDQYDATWAEYVKIPRDTIGDRLVEEIVSARKASDESNTKLDDSMKAGDFDAAIGILLTELRPRAVAWNEKISALLKHQEALTALDSDKYHAIESRTGTLSMIFGVLSIALGALIALFITRSMTRPLANTVNVVNSIAAGRLDNHIDTSGNDEVSNLLRAMQRMQAQLQAVIHAQQEIGKQHDAGTISYRIDETSFPGDYGVIVAGINQLVASHIAVKMRTVEIMRHYARGDLSVDMDRLPGDTAAITQAMDET